ncbi:MULTISPECIES: ATP-grasp domain-containing protein [Streptomyces]|uniref:ATP-grasp domain-containing protein n=1 Tax=Streptomyces TaxID=1883 RepID=UPI002F95C77E
MPDLPDHTAADRPDLPGVPDLPGLPGAAEPRPTAVLLNPRDLVIAAAQRLGLCVVVAADPSSPVPVPDGLPCTVLRTPWIEDPADLVRRLRALAPAGAASVFGFGEVGAGTAAAVNRELGWPGNPPEALEAFRDKARLRAVVGDRAGVPVAYAVCSDREQARAAVARIGFPCVIKPVAGTGSSGVRLLAAPEEAEAHLAALEFTARYVVEEFLEGTEYSVEAVSTPAGHRILAVTEKATTGAPHFVETGHVLPVRLDPADEAAVTAVVTATLDAAGLRYGPSHTEVMLTAAGPRLIESHGRPGGDRISDMLGLALGEDVFAQMMTAVFGLPEPAPAARRRVAGIRYVTFDRGVPVPPHGTGSALVASLPGVAEVEISVPAGELPPAVAASGDRHGFVVATGDTREELEANLARAVRTLTAA